MKRVNVIFPLRYVCVARFAFEKKINFFLLSFVKKQLTIILVFLKKVKIKSV